MIEDFQIRNMIETDIEKAVEICNKCYSREDIWTIIKTESTENPKIDIEKQICILNLDSILSQDEADLLAYHQTNHHGLIREATAQKINEFMNNP